MSWPFNSYPKIKSNQSGLTLVELIVVITIVTIMTAIVMSNLPAFRSKIELDLIAQEVAITIRQAQAFGAASRGGLDTANFGLNFKRDDGTGGARAPGFSTTHFVLFGDKDGDHKFEGDAGPGVCDNECVEVFEFRGGVSITNIQDGGDNTIGHQYLSIMPRPPQHEMAFYGYNSGSGNVDALSAVGKIRITISRGSDYRYVYVWNTGHIYVSKE
ncbi:MAG: type II secretion system protein [Patescibacteria group bacterium]|nr:type II secretion system protein [Patescibacteria group bacterium]